MKVALILPTAFIATLRPGEEGKLRVEQLCAGFERVRQLLARFPNIDVFWADNTISTEASFDPRLYAALRALPRLKGEYAFSDNEYGKSNKGCGVLAIWCKVLPDIVRGGYDYVIHFEPRQELSNFSFFETFANSPASYFKVTRVRVKKWKVFSFILKQFWTGLFACRPDDLLHYASVSDLKRFVVKRISLETDMFCYFSNQAIPFQTVKQLGLQWHDSDKNVHVPI